MTSGRERIDQDHDALQNLAAWAQIGLLQERMEQYREAEATLRSILEHDPVYVTRFDLVARFQPSPLFADVHHALARVLQKQDQVREAKLHYHLARQLEPEIELDPMYTEIMSEDDLTIHPYFDGRGVTEPEPGPGAKLDEKVKFVLKQSSYEQAVDAVARLKLTADVDELASTIQKLQHIGAFGASAYVRLVGDLASGQEARGLFDGLNLTSWTRLLELSQELKKGHFDETEARRLAGRIQIEPASALHFRRLVRRFVRLEPDTGKYVSFVAQSSMTQSSDRVVRAAGYDVQGLTCFQLGFREDAETALLRACNELEVELSEEVIVSVFLLLCRVQIDLGKLDAAVQNARRFVSLAAADGGPGTRAEAEALSAHVLAQKGDLAGSLAAALRAWDLVRAHGLTGTVAEEMSRHIAAVREALGEAAAEPVGTPSLDVVEPTLEDEISIAEREIAEKQHERAIERLRRVEQRVRDTNRYGTLVQALISMGRALRARGDFAEADTALQRALFHADMVGPDADRFVIFVELSFVAEQRGDRDNAVSWMEKALAESRRTGESEREIASHDRLVRLLADTDSLRAVDHLRHVVAADRSSREDWPTELQRGDEAYNAKRFPEVIAAFEPWLSRDPPRDARRATVTANLAGAYYAIRDVETAQRLFVEAADLSVEVGLPVAAVELLSRAVLASFKAGMATGDVLAKLIAVAESIENPPARRWSLANAAESAALADDFAAAERLARASLELATSAEWRDLGHEVECRMTLGRVYRATGRYREAINEYTAALAIAQRLSDEPQEGTIRGWKAVAHRYLNEPDRSVQEYSKAIQIAVRYGELALAASHRFNMASVLVDLERRDEALEALSTALRTFDQEGMGWMSARVLMGLDQYWSDDELPSEIIARLEAMEEELLTSSDRMKRCWALSGRSRRLAAQGKAVDAACLMDEVIEAHRRANDHYNAAVATLGRAMRLADADLVRATHDAEQALEMARSMSYQHLVADCLELLTGFAMRLDQGDAIERRVGEVLAVWLEIRRTFNNDRDRIRYADRTARIAKDFVSKLLAGGRPARAFELIEWSRAQALGDLIASRLEAASEASEDSELDEEGDDIGGSELSSFLKSPIPERLTVVRAPLRIDETAMLLGRLERDVVLVSMSYVDDRLVGFVLRNGQEEPRLVPMDMTRSDVAALLSTYRSEMYDMCGAGALSWLHAGSRLMRPFAGHIRDGDLVVLVLDDDLQILPMSALELTTGERLIDRAAVCHAPSATVLGQIADRKAARNGEQSSRPLEFLSIGIAYPEEAIAIQREFSGIALTGNVMAKSAIRDRLPRHRILHVSSHGHFDPEMPLESGLHLRSSGSALLGHILSVRDLRRFRLACDLITLSACESGLGQVAVSEFLGLTRNLLAAGADSVVNTLWPVDPRPTLRFMLRFYHELSEAAERSPSVDIAEALRQAQIALGREVDLAGWAGFKLVGWPRMTVDKHAGSEQEEHE